MSSWSILGYLMMLIQQQRSYNQNTSSGSYPIEQNVTEEKSAKKHTVFFLLCLPGSSHVIGYQLPVLYTVP
jgi:hypothetical protein